MPEPGSQHGRPSRAFLTGVALAACLVGSGCAALEPRGLGASRCAETEGERVRALEAEIERLRSDLRQAEESLRDSASGLDQELTMADAVSALAEGRVHTRAAAQAAPWRRQELEAAHAKLEEADRQLQAGHFGSAVFFAMRASSIADRLVSEAQRSPDVRRVRVGRANVRSGPSQAHQIVGVLARDTTVLQEQVDGEWVRVKMPSGESAWIHVRLLEAFEAN